MRKCYLLCLISLLVNIINAQVQNDNCIDALDLGVIALNESRIVAYDLTYATDS